MEKLVAIAITPLWVSCTAGWALLLPIPWVMAKVASNV